MNRNRVVLMAGRSVDVCIFSSSLRSRHQSRIGGSPLKHRRSTPFRFDAQAPILRRIGTSENRCLKPRDRSDRQDTVRASLYPARDGQAS